MSSPQSIVGVHSFLARIAVGRKINLKKKITFQEIIAVSEERPFLFCVSYKFNGSTHTISKTNKLNIEYTNDYYFSSKSFFFFLSARPARNLRAY